MNFGFFEMLEQKTLDMRFLIRGPVAPGPETLIAAIDEKSINKLGRFPWPRSVWGRVVERLTEEGAKVIVFDVFFTEPENVESDDLFQGAIRRSGRVILPVVFDFSEIGYKDSGFTSNKLDFMSPSAFAMIRNSEESFYPFKAKMVLPTLFRFSSAANSLAHINMIPDSDGTLRWEVLAVKLRRRLFRADRAAGGLGLSGIEKIGTGARFRRRCQAGTDFDPDR